MVKLLSKRFLILLIFCTVFWLWNIGEFVPLPDFFGKNLTGPPTALATPSGNSTPTGTSSSQPSGSPGPSASSQTQKDSLPLLVQRLYLKASQVWLTIGRSGKGNIREQDFRSTFVNVHGSQTALHDEWKLLHIDPDYQLRKWNGKIEFNTKLTLPQTDELTAIIRFRSWKVSKKQILTPPIKATSKAMTGQKSADGTAGASATPENYQSQAALPPSKAGAATSSAAMPMQGSFPGISGKRQADMNIPETAPGGVSFTAPRKGKKFKMGDRIPTIVHFIKSIGKGNVTINLRRVGQTKIYESKTYYYQPGPASITSTGNSLSVDFQLPIIELTPADNFYLSAKHAAGNLGFSETFSINLKREGVLQFENPKAGDLYRPSSKLRFEFKIDETAQSGMVHFALYAHPSHPPVKTWWYTYHSRDANTTLYQDVILPGDLPASNLYFTIATLTEGSGKSGTFTICPSITRGGAEVVEDLALTDIVLDNEGKVKALVKVSGAHFPLVVYIAGAPPPDGELSHLLYPGDNEIVLNDYIYAYGSDGSCSKTFTVQIDPSNRYTEPDTNNSLTSEIFYRTQNGKISILNHTVGDIFIPCDAGSGSHDVVFLVKYCGITFFPVSDIVSEVRQRGTRPVTGRLGTTEVFDDSVSYDLMVKTEIGDFFLPSQRNNRILPGESAVVWVHHESLSAVDSDLTLYIKWPATTWPGIRQPYPIHINWGEWDPAAGSCTYD